MYKEMKLVAMCVGISCLLCSFIIGSANAAGYPEQPIVIVNPWSTGGVSDNSLTVFRTFGDKYFGVPIIISQRKGATGTVGCKFVADSKPDGYTLGLVSSDPVTVVPQFREVPFDPMKDFTFIAQWASCSDCFAVRADLPINTMQEFHDYAKNNPGKVRIGQVGADGEGYLFHKRLEELWKFPIINIPFDSTGETTVACVGGKLEAMTASAVGIKPMIDAGKLRVIAMIGSIRDPIVPNVKTCKEMGIDAVFDDIYGFHGPKNLPPEVVTFVQDKTKAMLEDPQVRQAFDRIGVPLVYANSKDFRKRFEDDFVLFRRLIKGQ